MIDTAVLVVGAGPAGLTAALALARYGVNHVVVEEHDGTAHTPRAHIINQRTMEILRHLGIEDRVTDVATPQEMMANRFWFTTLADREVLRHEVWGNESSARAAYQAASPSSMVNCPQTVFEPVLLDALRDGGSDVMFSTEYVESGQDGDGYVSIVRHRRTGATEQIRSRFIVGADGGRSRVAEEAGLRMQGAAAFQSVLNIWFRADLSRFLARRPGVLSFNVHPRYSRELRLRVLICYKQFTEFAITRIYDPDLENLGQMTETEAKGNVEALVGEPLDDLEILGLFTWKMNALVAERFSHGSIFCIGDAVHRHPPSTGMGLNMSVADAYNLAWKIALVDRKIAGMGLLESYDAERRPVDFVNVGRALRAGGDMADVPQALGLGPEVDEADQWEALARWQSRNLRDGEGCGLKRALDLNNYQFNGLNAELGYRYTTGALCQETSGEDVDAERLTLLAADPEERTRAATLYRPTTAPGARLPHCRLERDHSVVSSLDLIAGTQFGLFISDEPEPWERGARHCSDALSVDLVVIHIGGEILDPYREWEQRREVDLDGAVLVRPDRHVAWRCVNRPADVGAALEAALREVLCLEGAHQRGGSKNGLASTLDQTTAVKLLTGDAELQQLGGIQWP